MDSSHEQPSKPSNSTPPPLSESSLQVKESAVFSYVSSLSPIKPDKEGPVAQGFPGINSPPFISKSPQTNAKPNFIERPQFAGSSDAGLSGWNKSCSDPVKTVDESSISSSHSRSGFRNCTQKTFITGNSAPEEARSPPGCADDCLTEIVNMDGGDSTSSLDLTPKSSNDFFHSQNDLSDSKVSVENIEDNDDVRKEEMKISAPPAMLEQAEKESLRDSLSDVKSVVLDQKSGDCNMSPDLCPKTDPDKSADHASENHGGGHLTSENAGAAHVFEVDRASLSESLQIAQDCGSCLENAGACTEAAKKKMHDHSPKVVQPHHGITRRLQFEDAQGKITADAGVRNSSGTAVYPKSPASTADSEVLESTSQNKSASPNNRLLANMAPPLFSPRNAANYNLKIPKRSGIGLHLNSIVNSMQMGSGAKVHVKSTELGSFDGLGKKLISISSCNLCRNHSVSSNVDVASMSSDGSKNDKHALIAENSPSSLSPYSVKPLYEAAVLKPIELQSSPSNRRKSNSETSDSFEDLGQLSPRKKSRKRTFDASDSNSCKRCNCKKTKCLKLYCDCFAAGIYCAESCACQGCFNRIEYEDTVLETRQQIESRNPLAFATKIIQHCHEPQPNVSVDDGTPFAPSSARHKKGCNCKKSKCLKKYCECYQANVGCSDKCRCEACENIYGRKGEFGTIKDLITKHSEKSESPFDMMQKLVASKDVLVHNELYNPHNLTPLTPSFPSSDHGKGASKAWLSSGGYLQSPESGLNFTVPFGMSTRQATNPDNCDLVLHANNDVIDLVSFGQGLDYGNRCVVNQFSPRCGVPRNAGNSTVVPNPEDWANNSRAQFFSGNHQFSSPSSLHWRGSPITPSTHFGENKLHKVVDSKDGLYSIMDDGTPEILKEPPVPTDVVKVSSPNKKRVSPPHGLRELGSSSSAGLRTGRKFILQAVPSFPPLTPCIDSKGVTSVNNSQNSSSSK